MKPYDPLSYLDTVKKSIEKDLRKEVKERPIQATRVAGVCVLCGRQVEAFDYFYLTDDGRVSHDYCFELSEESNKD